jgi:hypothetical protein
VGEITCYIGKERPHWDGEWSLKTNVKLTKGTEWAQAECAAQAIRRAHGYLNHEKDIGTHREFWSWGKG